MAQNLDKNNSSDEIDFLGVLTFIWSGRKIMLKTIIGFIVIAFIYVFTTPKEYTSNVKLLVETGNRSGLGGLLQQFGGLSGIGGLKGANEEALSLNLYPEIIHSTPFLLEVMNMRVTDLKYDSTLKVTEYLDRHTKKSLIGFIAEYTIGVPGLILKQFKSSYNDGNRNDWPLYLNERQTDLLEMMDERISAEQDDKFSTLKITVTMQDPLLVACLTDSIVKTLQKYIIEYRTKKAQTDYEFVFERYKEAETRYLKAQRELSSFKDQNKNIILASYQTTEQNLQADFNLAFGLYSGISQQLEQSKMKVQENTPIFKIIEPSIVPNRKSSPRTVVILFVTLFLGIVTGVSILYAKKTISNFATKNN